MRELLPGIFRWRSFSECHGHDVNGPLVLQGESALLLVALGHPERAAPGPAA